MPQGATIPAEEEYIDRVVEIYLRAAEEIRAQIGRSIARAQALGVAAPAPSSRDVGLLRQIDAMLVQLGAQSEDIVLQAITQVYRDSSARAVDAIREELGPDADIDVSFGLIDRRAVAALAQQLDGSLREASLQLRGKVQRFIRSTQTPIDGDVRREVGAALAAGRTRRELTTDLRAQLRAAYWPSDAIDIFGDLLDDVQIRVGGWRGSLAEYARLTSRTMMRDASTAATINRTVANGLQILEVTSVRTTQTACKVFEGLLVSATGEDERFPHVNQLPNGGPPHHPNCRHNLAPRSLEFLTDDEIRVGTKIKTRYLGRTWSELDRIFRKDFGGNKNPVSAAARMRADARG